MVAELDGLDDLLEAWRGLALGDRKAIMRRLPPDRRHLFQRMLAASPAKDREEAEQALRYRAYAPWLGRAVWKDRRCVITAVHRPASRA